MFSHEIVIFSPWQLIYVNGSNWDEPAPRPARPTAMRHGNHREIDSEELGPYFACHYFISISNATLCVKS